MVSYKLHRWSVEKAAVTKGRPCASSPLAVVGGGDLKAVGTGSKEMIQLSSRRLGTPLFLQEIKEHLGISLFLMTTI